MTALSVLQRYDFKRLHPGQNDEGLIFSGPGIVLICHEKPPVKAGEVQFEILTAFNAPNDALAIAKNALKQRAANSLGVFAMLAQITTHSEREKALAELAPMCSEGI